MTSMSVATVSSRPTASFCLNSHDSLLSGLLEAALTASGSLYMQQPEGCSCDVKSSSFSMRPYLNILSGSLMGSY